MVASSLWNVILPGKLAIISQRPQLSQLYSTGKGGGKEQARDRRSVNRGNEFMGSSKDKLEASMEATRRGGRRSNAGSIGCRWYGNVTFTLGGSAQ